MSLLLLFRSVAVSPPAITLREADDRLALSVTHADGSVTRWAGDEAEAELVAGNLEFGSVVPGGFKDLTCELLRGLTPRADEGLFDDVRCYGAGNRTAWEGRMAQLPRTNVSLRPGAVGWSAHLEDDPSFVEVYVDRDLTAWQEATIARRLAAWSEPWGDYSVSTDVGGIVFEGITNKLVPSTSTATLMRIMPAGTAFGAIAHRGIEQNNANVEAAYFWVDAREELTSPWDRVTLALDDAAHDQAVGSSVRYGMIRAFAAANHTPTAQFRRTYKAIAVYGTHGLARRSMLPDLPGLYVTDIVADVVKRGAPLLEVASDAIQPSTFVIGHFTVPDPTTPADVIARLNAYLLWDWGVWEDRAFRMRPPTDDLVWVARLSDGAQLDLEGDQAQDIYNGVVVSFTDPNGRRRVVGPPGAAADVTDASLADADPTNPVNAHGIPRRWAKLELSTVTTDLGAIQIGGIYLAEAKLAKRRGTLTVTGGVEKQGQPGRWPAWSIRAGDYVTVGDRAGEPLRRVIEARYSHATRTTTMTLDSSAQKLDAILERLNAALVGVLGG